MVVHAYLHAASVVGGEGETTVCVHAVTILPGSLTPNLSFFLLLLHSNSLFDYLLWTMTMKTNNTNNNHAMQRLRSGPVGQPRVHLGRGRHARCHHSRRPACRKPRPAHGGSAAVSR